jgi:hypothetical protein
MTATEPTETRLGHDRINATYFEKIHTIFDQIGVSPDESIIVGGQVLAAYGIRPAKDLDILVGPQTFIDVHKGNGIPPGVSIGSQEGERRPGVVSLSWDNPNQTGSRYTAEVICRYDPSSGTSAEEAQLAFSDRIKNETIKVGGLHFTTLEDTVQHMQEHPHYNGGQNRGKTARDIQKIRQLAENHMNRIETDAPIQLDDKTAENVSTLLKKGWLRKIARTVVRG